MPNPGEFRQIMQQIKDLDKNLKKSSHEGLEKELKNIKDTVNILEGNQATFADEVFRKLDEVKVSVSATIAPLVERISDLEKKVEEMIRADRDDALTPPSAKRRRSTDPENRQIMETLLKEVLEIEDVRKDPRCTTRRVEGAISATFQTAKKRKRIEEAGLAQVYKERSRKTARFARKKTRRENFLSEEEKASRLAETIDPALISSEESDQENIIVRPLYWRNEEVSNFMKQLDERWLGSLTDPAKRQTAKRKIGVFSERTANVVPDRLKWAVNQFPDIEDNTDI